MAIKKLTNGTTTTTTTGNPYWINAPAIPGQVITTSGGAITWNVVEYVDIFYQLMGIDMDYKRFSLMSKEEKRSFIRDIKLQKLIDDK